MAEQKNVAPEENVQNTETVKVGRFSKKIATTPVTKETALKIKNTLTGRKRPEEVKLILRKAHSSECIPVKQYDDYGNLIASYNSIMDAERVTGVRNSGISACLKGRVKHAGGFIWKQN